MYVDLVSRCCGGTFRLPLQCLPWCIRSFIYTTHVDCLGQCSEVWTCAWEMHEETEQAITSCWWALYGGMFHWWLRLLRLTGGRHWVLDSIHIYGLRCGELSQTCPGIISPSFFHATRKASVTSSNMYLCRCGRRASRIVWSIATGFS